jgi:hypothetical protein
MAAISYERHYIIQKPMLAKKLNTNLMIKTIVVCAFVSLFWSSMPLIGWSYYSLEEGKTGCCVEYKEKSLNVISYNVSMFLFVFIIPFSFILVSNIRLYLNVTFFFFHSKLI